MRVLVFLLALFAAIQSAAAEDGRALVVTGRVMLERASPGAFSNTAVLAGSEIRRGDLIRTGNDGRVQIRFSDGSIVSLQPGTAFRIDEYRFAKEDRRAFFYLLRGALRTVTGAIGKTNHDEYRMKTPTATVGVRGTEYVAEQTVCDPRCAPGPRAGLRVAVTQGRIVLLTDAGTIEVDTGQAAAAESADAPPRHTERGPVLPPISLNAPRERSTGGTTTAAGTGGQTAGRAGTVGTADAVGAKAFDPTTAASDGTLAPAAKDRRTQAPAAPENAAGVDARVDVWPRFFASEGGLPAAAVSPNERRGPEGALLPVLEQISPAGRPGGQPGRPGGQPGHPDDNGHTLRVLEPWGHGIDPNGTAGSLTLDDRMRLTAFEWCSFGWLCRIEKGNTRVAEAGHDAWTSWGRWTGGHARASALHWPLHIPGNEGLHYLVGVPSTTIPTSGVFGYELVGATQATLSPGSQTGHFDGRAAVAFSPSGAQVGVDASVAFANATYRFATPGGADDPTLSTIVTGAGHAFRGQLGATGTGARPVACSPQCPVQLDGGLFGPEAARLGITYRITGNGGGSTISGVGVFGRKGPQE